MRLLPCLRILAGILFSSVSFAANLTVTPTQTFQTLEGIGGGIPYWQQQGEVVDHKQSATILDTLFTGARVSYIRVNLADTMPGWTDKYPYMCWNQSATLAPQCTAYVARSTWGPLKKIVTGAQTRLGYRPKIFVSVWSPPAHLKASGYTQGLARNAAGVALKNSAGGDSIFPRRLNTLRRNASGKYMYAEVAHWMRKSLENFRDTMGFFPDRISLQNEPWTNVFYGSCNYAPTENDSVAGYAQMLKALYDTLKASHPGLEANLVGPEVEGIMHTRAWTPGWEQYAATYIRAFSNPNHVGAYAFHFYSGGNYFSPRAWNQWTDSLNLKFPGKPLIMSEYCWLSKGHDTSASLRKIKLVGLGHTLTQALTRGNISAYINWEMTWNFGQMIDMGTWNAQRYNVNPEYHATRHFSRFTSPGWVRIGSSSTDTLVPVAAFANPTSDTISVMTVNTTPTNQSLTLPTLSGYALRTYVLSTGSAYSQNLSIPTSSTITLPDSSVATFQYVRLPNQAPTISLTTTSTNTLWAPGAITFTYTAKDPDGTVKLVELLQNNVGVKYVPLATPVASTSGTFALSNLAVGSYVFLPKVTDNLGKVGYGPSFTATVAWNYALTTSGASNWYGGLYISYALPTGVAATAQVMTATGTLVKSIGLATGTTSARFTALSGKPAGNYVVQLLVNGVVVTSVPVSKT